MEPFTVYLLYDTVVFFKLLVISKALGEYEPGPGSKTDLGFTSSNPFLVLSTESVSCLRCNAPFYITKYVPVF